MRLPRALPFLALGSFLAWHWHRARNPRGILRDLPISERRIWLTLDDGPDRHDTEGMLDALAEYGAKASFFGIGRHVENYPTLATRIVAAGHTLENHTHSHRSALLWLRGQSVLASEISRTSQTIEAATGERPRFFRAPAGLWSRAMLEAVRQAGLLPVGWSAGGGEGTCRGDLLAAVDRTIRELHPGAIVLLHQGGRRGRVAALRLFLQRAHTEGWTTLDPREIPALLPARCGIEAPIV